MSGKVFMTRDEYEEKAVTAGFIPGSFERQDLDALYERCKKIPGLRGTLKARLKRGCWDGAAPRRCGWGL